MAILRPVTLMVISGLERFFKRLGAYHLGATVFVENLW
jgi:hypothetical protein